MAEGRGKPSWMIWIRHGSVSRIADGSPRRSFHTHTHIYIYIYLKWNQACWGAMITLSVDQKSYNGWMEQMCCAISLAIFFWEYTHDRSLQVCFTSVWHHEKETEPRVWRLNNHQESWDPMIALGHFKYGDSFCFFPGSRGHRGPISCRSHWLQAGLGGWLFFSERWDTLEGPATWAARGTTSWRTCCLIPCWATAGDGGLGHGFHRKVYKARWKWGKLRSYGYSYSQRRMGCQGVTKRFPTAW